MDIAFRVDSGRVLGSGHVMRCLTLAHELKKSHRIVFICATIDGHMIDQIKDNGFEVYSLPNLSIKTNTSNSYQVYDWRKDSHETINVLKNLNIDCLIIDHYMIDTRWESMIKGYTKFIVIIDDLANRKHNCDILIDQNFYLQFQNMYENLVPKNAQLLLGESYVLLRDEFLINKKKPIQSIKSIFVYFGASDLSNETKKIIKAYTQKKYNYKLNILLGYSNPYKNEIIRKYQSVEGIKMLDHNNKVSKLMLESDIAIGAGGSTTWERCCIGLASVVVTVAENQFIPMKELEEKGVITILKNPSVSIYGDLLDKIETTSLEYWHELQVKGMQLFDGRGKKRIMNAIERLDEYGY